MDKQRFDNEILAQTAGGAGSYFNGWHNRRREILRQLNPDNRSIDVTFIQAITAMGGISPEIEKLVPGISEKYRRCLDLQNQLLHDLVKLNKIIANEITPFREWLSQL